MEATAADPGGSGGFGAAVVGLFPFGHGGTEVRLSRLGVTRLELLVCLLLASGHQGL